jgi:hypothetical protein
LNHGGLNSTGWTGNERSIGGDAVVVVVARAEEVGEIRIVDVKRFPWFFRFHLCP